MPHQYGPLIRLHSKGRLLALPTFFRGLGSDPGIFWLFSFIFSHFTAELSINLSSTNFLKRLLSLNVHFLDRRIYKFTD